MKQFYRVKDACGNVVMETKIADYDAKEAMDVLRRDGYRIFKVKVKDKPAAKPTPTPGPWSVDDDLAKENRVISGPNGEVIAEVYQMGEDFNTGDSSIGPERDANARLIATAPDMADALRNIVSNLSGPDNRMERWHDSLRLATEALAKID